MSIRTRLRPSHLQATIITVWNLAIASGRTIGGPLLGTLGVAILPWVVIAASASTPVAALAALRQGFPRHGE